MKAASLTAPMTGEAEPSDPPLRITWLTEGSVRLSRAELFSGDDRVYVDLDQVGTISMDVPGALVPAMRLIDQLHQLGTLGRRRRRTLHAVPRVAACG